jgi:hypothetical protein
MIYRTLLVTALLLPFAFGNVAAHGCAHGEVAATAVGPLYVAGTSIYQESNTHTGLQTAGGSCENDDGRLIVWAADTQLA